VGLFPYAHCTVRGGPLSTRQQSCMPLQVISQTSSICIHYFSFIPCCLCAIKLNPTWVQQSRLASHYWFSQLGESAGSHSLIAKQFLWVPRVTSLALENKGHDRTCYWIQVLGSVWFDNFVARSPWVQPTYIVAWYVVLSHKGMWQNGH